MPRYKYLLTFVLLSVVLVIDSCVSHDLEETDTCQDISYASDIAPIINTKCALSGCHNGSNPDLPNWTILTQLQNRKDDVKRMVVNRIMPKSSSPAGPLTEDQINTIACWVDQGAPNN